MPKPTPDPDKGFNIDLNAYEEFDWDDDFSMEDLCDDVPDALDEQAFDRWMILNNNPTLFSANDGYNFKNCPCDKCNDRWGKPENHALACKCDRCNNLSLYKHKRMTQYKKTTELCYDKNKKRKL